MRYKFTIRNKNIIQLAKKCKIKIKRILVHTFLYYDKKNIFFGEAEKEAYSIYINVLCLFNFPIYGKELERTIIHELLHLFFPSKSENDIEKETYIISENRFSENDNCKYTLIRKITDVIILKLNEIKLEKRESMYHIIRFVNNFVLRIYLE